MNYVVIYLASYSRYQILTKFDMFTVLLEYMDTFKSERQHKTKLLREASLSFTVIIIIMLYFNLIIVVLRS